MKHSERLELDKILAEVASHAALEGAKAAVLALEPSSSLSEARERLDFTEEALLLLFELGAGRIESFPPLGDIPERAEKGSVLSPAELLAVAALLRSARVFARSVQAFSDARIVKMRGLADRLVCRENLEEEIGEKIVNEEEIADHASARLYEIRQEIRRLNERIRARLTELLGEEKEFLQDSVVTMRGDRYVLPVKVEYKRSVRGFIHDRSASGATVFIEPEEVLELNNELKSLRLDEKEETERILSELSRAVGGMRFALERDEETLAEADGCYARAEYAYRLKCVKPVLNDRGIVEIVRGRHPLLDQKKATPVSVSFGEKYSFLLISGANTGGKTVTLKMCGLFCLMAACGLFAPAAEGTRLSVFDGVYCDVGDSQSIEENLSTFSSHILNLKEIASRAGARSLVLIDEPGGGTDPEEGQALARAFLSALMRKGCKGVVTTHYSALKEFAYRTEGIENGCMEFDSESLRPLYRLKIGAPGSSNALLICTRLGLGEEIVEEARGYLSEGARAFEYTVRAAEESRVRADEAREKAAALEKEWGERLAALEREEQKFAKEREKFLRSSKAEARRIVAENTAEAEELLGQIEEIVRKKDASEADLIRARTLKNKLSAVTVAEEEEKLRARPADPEKLKAGDVVFVKSLGAEGVVLSVKRGLAEVRCGALRVRCGADDLFEAKPREKTEGTVQVVRNLGEPRQLPRECNLIGLTAAEAIPELENFLDSALLANLSEVRIVHGMGTGKLRAAVHSFLRSHKRVESFRLGKYGEGESGVTIVTLR